MRHTRTLPFSLPLLPPPLPPSLLTLTVAVAASKEEEEEEEEEAGAAALPCWVVSGGWEGEANVRARKERGVGEEVL